MPINKTIGFESKDTALKEPIKILGDNIRYNSAPPVNSAVTAFPA